MDIFKEKVLLLFSDPHLLGAYKASFEKNYQLQVASSAQMADFLLQEWEPRVCVLENTEEILQWIPKLREKKGFLLGILVLSSKRLKDCEEQAFRYGADHFMNDDCDYEQIRWRVQSLIRRSSGVSKVQGMPSTSSSAGSAEVIQVENLRIYKDDFLVKRMGEVVNVSPTQFRLLMTFASHPDQLLSRDWLKTEIWESSDISPRSIDAHISKLKKLVPEFDRHLLNVYGKGYVFSLSKQKAA